MYKLKNGQYKDFVCLYCDYVRQNSKDDIAKKIMMASIASGLKGLKSKDDRALMYDKNNGWLEVINQLL